LRNYPSERFVAFHFLGRGAMYPSLIATGLFYNLGIWADKLVFWFSPDTSAPVIGPLRRLHHLRPAGVSCVPRDHPRMAVFLVRIETDFVE